MRSVNYQMLREGYFVVIIILRCNAFFYEINRQFRTVILISELKCQHKLLQ